MDKDRMRETFTGRLLLRETQPLMPRRRSHHALYGDRSLVSALDIVNELDGHSGCVNALSWSKSGRLLASGSDDRHLNIYAYQPDDSTAQFRLSSTVSTGHTQNIFSVKFMPQHDDRVVVTAAGDGEVRIFDLEHAGRTYAASSSSTNAAESRRRGRHTMFNGVRYLSDGDTDCRVYRSHGDRVKRIVTESSPFLFLTCSEDGEVRQWDLRQPSSAYPSQDESRSFAGLASNVPPPLISYKHYNVHLNTISCSANQPHYIALGGSHLHAFLHDRRMAGRDLLSEAGGSAGLTLRSSSQEAEVMRQATRCVRKFAPTGQPRMRGSEKGHITACKISDARPDEMIVSWSGDHVYSFDLVRSPDATELPQPAAGARSETAQFGSQSERKRKRRIDGNRLSPDQESIVRAPSRPRTNMASAVNSGSALRIRYANGQSEDIPISAPNEQSSERQTTQQRNARRIARSVASLRASLFRAGSVSSSQYTEALGHAASILSDMDEDMRAWTYPLDPSPVMVQWQQAIRRDRESGRRLVQTGGVLARVLGGKLQTPSGSSPLLVQFSNVDVRNSELPLLPSEQFGHDFVRAIVLWLESGVGRLVEGFTRATHAPMTSRMAERCPISESDAALESIDDILIPYLLQHASEKPVTDLTTNEFERDELRVLFQSEREAVLRFAAAIKTPFADLSSDAPAARSEDDAMQTQDRSEAVQFWAVKVARGILWNSSQHITPTNVDRAFGGDTTFYEALDEGQLSSPSSEEAVAGVELMDPMSGSLAGANTTEIADVYNNVRRHGRDVATEQSSSHDTDDEHETYLMTDADDDDNNDDDADDDDDDNEDLVRISDEDEYEMHDFDMSQLGSRSYVERARLREQVESGVPCSPYTRKYVGHCNVRTVKDVNYFGLDDEYVVSGSDDGNFFIWDRKTSELLNVLEGDGEVVNVIQGHPYETMLAVSGIDNTIKIFSPDARARRAAQLGEAISAHDSALSWPYGQSGRRREPRAQSMTAAHETGSEAAIDQHDLPIGDDSDDERVAAGGLSSRRRMHDAYRIMTRNDTERQSGNQENYITRQMLAQLAMRIRMRGADDVDATMDGLGPMRVMLGDDCAVQ